VTDDPIIERGVLDGAKVERVRWRDAAELGRVLAGCDAVLCMHAPINRAVIGEMRQCRAIVRYGTGLDNIDLDAAAAAGIAVRGVHDYCSEEVANHTLALLLGWNRRLVDYDRMVREKKWNERPSTTGNWGYGLDRLSGQTLGLVGFGHIGRAVAARAHPFGLKVLAYTPSIRPEAAAVEGVRAVSLDELLTECDFVSLHLPLNERTRGLIGREALGRMKPGAVLINTSRGALIDEAALVDALRSGRLGGALLDVYEKAPLPMEHPLRACSNTILTPHVAFYSEGSLAELRRRAAREVHKHLFSAQE
jgi:D-3-phosphoglycerate dehydrogenase